MPAKHARQSKSTIEHLPPNSAGRLMTHHVPTMDVEATIGDIEKTLMTAPFETINYIYVIDAHRRLKGVLSVKELFRTPREAKVKSVMHDEVVTARPHTDEEHVALLAVQHNLKAVPIVDRQHRFLGVVPSDVVLRVLHNEAVEDALRFAGIGINRDSIGSVLHTSALVHVQHRLPWLLLGLIGGMAAAVLVGFFEHALRTQLALAAFIPTVVYMADAVGTQTQTVFIRSLVVDHNFKLRSYLWREGRVSALIALVLTVVVMVTVWMWQRSMALATILGFSIFLTTLAAAVIAVVLPWMLSHFRFDPAIASGPFATVIRDLLSLLIYFGVAQALLGFI